MRDRVTVYFWTQKTQCGCWACMHVIPINGRPRTVRKLSRSRYVDNESFALKQIKEWADGYEESRLFGDIKMKPEIIYERPPCNKN